MAEKSNICKKPQHDNWKIHNEHQKYNCLRGPETYKYITNVQAFF